MSWRSEIYPYRNDRAQFTSRLWHKVDTDWREVAEIVPADGMPGGMQRCEIRNSTVVCDRHPNYLDRSRLKAVLKAWRRSISDRYLDLERVIQMDQRGYPSRAEAFEEIRQNAPTGAVKFVMNELQESHSPAFIGPRLWDGWGYDTYFTYLLFWDDKHCYGLINYLRREQGRYAVGGTPGHLWAAVRWWIYRNQHTGIYRETGVNVDD